MASGLPPTKATIPSPEMKPHKCDSCGGALPVVQAKIIECEFCGARYSIVDEKKYSVGVDQAKPNYDVNPEPRTGSKGWK